MAAATKAAAAAAEAEAAEAETEAEAEAEAASGMAETNRRPKNNKKTQVVYDYALSVRHSDMHVFRNRQLLRRKELLPDHLNHPSRYTLFSSDRLLF